MKIDNSELIESSTILEDPMKSIINNYLNIAENYAKNSNCARRNFGALILNTDNQIVSMGNNSTPLGRKSCEELGGCIREKLNVPHGTKYELCRSVHAEQEAIIKSSIEDTTGATLFLAGRDCITGEYVKNCIPCAICKKLIISAGISKVIYRISENDYQEISVIDWITDDDSINGEDSYAKLN